MSGWEALLRRADKEIEAARALLGSGFPAQSVSRAYFAAFYAAEAALLLLGESRSKHSGVLSAFGKLVVKERGFSEQIGGLLRKLFEARNEADYLTEDVPEEAAEHALADAERFVRAVSAWIQEAD